MDRSGLSEQLKTNRIKESLSLTRLIGGQVSEANQSLGLLMNHILSNERVIGRMENEISELTKRVSGLELREREVAKARVEAEVAVAEIQDALLKIRMADDEKSDDEMSLSDELETKYLEKFKSIDDKFIKLLELIKLMSSKRERSESSLLERVVSSVADIGCRDFKT